MASVRQSVVYASVSRYLLVAIGLVSTVVVARLLTPSELGIWAIGSSMVMIISEFRLLGAGIYIVREPELTESKIRSALGVTYLISWGLGGLLVLASPFIAGFYQIAELEPLFYLLSVSFFLAPFVSIPCALLERAMDFRTLGMIWVAGVTMGLVVTIGGILLGLSFYALALGLGANTITQVVCANLRVDKRYWWPWFHRIVPVIRLGIYSSASGMMKKSLLNVPDMIIGKLGTTTQVGMFSRGLGFVEFLSSSVQQGISPVVLPYLSGKVRERENVADAYLNAGVMLGAILWPVLAVAAVSSLPVIRFFFGDQWDQAAPLASVLAVWAMLRCVHVLLPELLLSTGREKLLLIREFVLLAVCVLGLLLLFRFGLLAAASTFVLVGLVDVLLGGWIVRHRFALAPARVLKAWLPNVGLAGMCALVAWSLDNGLSLASEPPWQAVVVLAVVLVPVWYLGLWLLRNPLWEEVQPARVKAVFRARHG